MRDETKIFQGILDLRSHERNISVEMCTVVQ